MDTSTITLSITAFILGLTHTLMGPDHYVPFIALSRSRNWSLLKTSVVTAICGLGHVASSIAIGFIGIAIGTALSKLEFIESLRGDIAGWLLLAFGLLYMVWGIKRYFQHDKDHHHHHDTKKELTFWLIFLIFVFGPCEPLIPLLMYPASHNSWMSIVIVSLTFTAATVGTMLTVIVVTSLGLKSIKLPDLHRASHALAGFIVMMCGVAIKAGL